MKLDMKLSYYDYYMQILSAPCEMNALQHSVVSLYVMLCHALHNCLYALQCIALHRIALHCIALHCIALHCIAL
jgi:hypothetical protein